MRKSGFIPELENLPQAQTGPKPSPVKPAQPGTDFAAITVVKSLDAFHKDMLSNLQKDA